MFHLVECTPPRWPPSSTGMEMFLGIVYCETIQFLVSNSEDDVGVFNSGRYPYLFILEETSRVTHLLRFSFSKHSIYSAYIAPREDRIYRYIYYYRMYLTSMEARGARRSMSVLRIEYCDIVAPLFSTNIARVILPMRNKIHQEMREDEKEEKRESRE